eukprot:TRINITY_DN12191_c0_g1_i1.p1 TRINITY_DN12191_c0_g1~~TRINITY_DN12191_c0_g1_i1.p1  ORF type:complete len:170 (-),score=12.83 TRINITY_DN12191_c0_g1_i1:202-666(-)
MCIRDRCWKESEIAPCKCRKILSVDDNDYNQMVVSQKLSKIGFNIVKAFNGLEAIEILKEELSAPSSKCIRKDCSIFSLILTDLHMPIMNGIDLVKEVRKLPGIIGKIPIVMLSASDEKDQVDEGFKAGMNDFLLKPLTDSSVAEVLRRFNIYS